jgi:hypothetical protein
MKFTHPYFIEMPTKRNPATHVPQNIEQKLNEITLNEDEKIYSAPKNVSSPETKTAALGHAGTTEMRGIEKIDEDDSTENKRDKTREHSPPTKQVSSSSKNVRFKDDAQEEEKRPETSPKQLHSDGKVGGWYRQILLHLTWLN